MVQIGYTMMTEQSGPRDLVKDVVGAEHAGRHFRVHGARLWDLPETPVSIGIAVCGDRLCAIAGRHADVMIAVEPERSLVEAFEGRRRGRTALQRGGRGGCAGAGRTGGPIRRREPM